MVLIYSSLPSREHLFNHIFHVRIFFSYFLYGPDIAIYFCFRAIDFHTLTFVALASL